MALPLTRRQRRVALLEKAVEYLRAGANREAVIARLIQEHPDVSYMSAYFIVKEAEIRLAGLTPTPPMNIPVVEEKEDEEEVRE
jgi:hypothetical protein